MKLKHAFLITICLLFLFSCDLFNTGGTGTLIFKGVTELPSLSKPTTEETVTDIDGNEYATIIVGGKVWMAENLKVTRYRNGNTLEYAPDSISWTEGTAGEYCFYDNDSSYIDTFGYLYNWYAVNDWRGLAPEGWHVATDDDWKHLEMALGMSYVDADSTGWRGTNEGNKLKSTYRWNANGSGTDLVGFTALPGGYMFEGVFANRGIDASFWTSSDVSDTENAWWRDIYYNRESIRRYAYDKNMGLSVRCVKDLEADDAGTLMYNTGIEFDIHEMWVSTGLVREGISDNFEWHLIGGDQGLIPMEDHEFTADEIPVGEYKSIKIVFRNRIVRHAAFVSDTTQKIVMASSLGEGDVGDSSFVINYFSSNGSFIHTGGGFELMAAGENMPTFTINADRITWIYWKGGGPESEWTDFTFRWHDYDGNGLWTPGIDVANNFEGPEDIPMWTFMVVEE